MDICELNLKIKEAKEKSKRWAKQHMPEIIVYGTTALIGTGIVAYAIKKIDSMEVTVDDVTEVTKLDAPDVDIKLKNEITMYDDRLDCWVPVIRKLTEDEFDEIKQVLEENPDATLTGCLTVRDLLPDYLYG